MHGVMGVELKLCRLCSDSSADKFDNFFSCLKLETGREIQVQ